jgi:hypothetical protein
MQKILLFILAFCGIASASPAQNFSIVEGQVNDITGDTVDYYIPNNSLDVRTYTVTNLLNTSVSVVVEKSYLMMKSPGAYVTFCADIACYLPADFISDTFVVAANGSFTLYWDYWPDNAFGISKVTASVRNVGTNNSAYFVAQYHCSGVGIAENSALNFSQVAPNPSSDWLHVQYKSGQTGKIYVLNMTGAIVREMETNANGESEIDVAELENGVYFIRLVAGNEAVTRRFVVSH